MIHSKIYQGGFCFFIKITSFKSMYMTPSFKIQYLFKHFRWLFFVFFFSNLSRKNLQSESKLLFEIGAIESTNHVIALSS